MTIPSLLGMRNAKKCSLFEGLETGQRNKLEFQSAKFSGDEKSVLIFSPDVQNANWSTRPTQSPASSDHQFHTCRPSTFQNLAKQNNFQGKIVIASGGTVGPDGLA